VTSPYDIIIRHRTIPKPIKIAIVLTINWVFQSILYMDRTEKVFKLAITASLGTIGALLSSAFVPALPSAWALGLGILVGHTVNWITNGNIPAVAKHFGVLTTSEKELTNFEADITQRLASSGWVATAAIYGSRARGGWTRQSDVDIRIVRNQGIKPAIVGCFALWALRFRAMLDLFPLDIYMFDRAEALDRMDPREKPIVLVGDSARPSQHTGTKRKES